MQYTPVDFNEIVIALVPRGQSRPTPAFHVIDHLGSDMDSLDLADLRSPNRPAHLPTGPLGRPPERLKVVEGSASKSRYPATGCAPADGRSDISPRRAADGWIACSTPAPAAHRH